MMENSNNGQLFLNFLHPNTDREGEGEWEDTIKRFTSYLQLEEVAPCFTIEMEFLADSMVLKLEEKVVEFLENYLKKLKWSLAYVTNLTHLSQQFVDHLNKIEQLELLIQKAQNLLGWGEQNLNPQGQPQLNSSLQRSLEKLKGLYIALKCHMMIPETQPSNLMKSSSKFTPSVRFLTTPTSGASQLAMSPRPSTSPMRGKRKKEDGHGLPVVKFEILTKKEMRSLYFDTKDQHIPLSTPPPGLHPERLEEADLLGNIGKSDVTQPLLILFKDAAINRVVRNRRKISQNSSQPASPASGDNHEDSAMKEKFFLKFSCRLNILGDYYEIWCCSTPFVFFTNTKQLPEAKGTVFWDTCFLEQNTDIPFKVLEAVPWSTLGPALAAYFKREVGPNICRDLTTLNLASLGKTLLSDCKSRDAQFGGMMERAKFFERRDQSDSEFSYWLWFHGIVKLFKNCKEIQDVWNAGLLIGFIDTALTERVLVSQEAGTFLIRLSWSKIGGITVSFTGRDKMVWHVGYGKEDLNVISLRERIRAEVRLSKVYCVDHLNREYVINKSDAFPTSSMEQDSAFSGGPSPQRRGYVTPMLLQLLQVPE